MFSFFKRAKKEEEVTHVSNIETQLKALTMISSAYICMHSIQDPDIELSDPEDNFEEDDELELMLTLTRVIPKNLKKEHFKLALSQISELESLVERIEQNGTLRVPEGVKEFINSELVTRAKNDKTLLDHYLGCIQDFSDGWKVYSKSKSMNIYLKENYTDGKLDSFLFGGE